MSRFIIIGLTSQGLALLRLLSRAGHQIVAFSNSKNAVGFYSKYGEKILFSDAEDLKRKISAIVGKSDKPVKCIIASGELLALVLEEYPELYDICDVESGPFDLVKMLSHKHLMYSFARSRGLPCADFRLLSDYEHGSLGYPVILKKNYESFPLFKVANVDSKEDFKNLVDGINANFYTDVIVQRYVDFDRDMFITYQCYISNSVRCCEFVAFQRRRTSTGLTCFLEEMKPSSLYGSIVELSARLLDGIDYKGFIEIEYAVDSSGNIYFMETNTRVCGTFSALFAKFPRLADVIALDESSSPKDHDFGKTKGLITWVNLARDIKVRLENHDLKNIGQTFFADKDVFDWRDPAPFFMQFLR